VYIHLVHLKKVCAGDLVVPGRFIGTTTSCLYELNYEKDYITQSIMVEGPCMVVTNQNLKYLDNTVDSHRNRFS
jgi:hypothetical protein